MLSPEFAWIDWVRNRTPQHNRVSIGIGDDAAVWQSANDRQVLVTVDMLMDGVDFIVAEASPERIGRKALAVNLSDIAAMGGRPVAAVVSVALPQSGTRSLAEGIYRGLQSLAAEYSVAVIGGDTNTWPQPLVISVTVLGDVLPGGPVQRNGAKPGDWILATGEFGGSILGGHFDFTPRVHEIASILAVTRLHSLIDVSDGLASDLGHILNASEVGAVLYADAIPVSAAAIERSKTTGRTPLDHALNDGEDFELLFTLPEAEARTLLAANPSGVPLTQIGIITKSRDYLLDHANGRREPLLPRGWSHSFDGP